MAGHEFILGGARSGKSRLAEARAAAWLAAPGHQALLIATAQAGDAEMTARISRHRADRAQRLPALQTLELATGPGDKEALCAALMTHAAPQRLLLVDCLTLWLTQQALPLHGPPAPPHQVQAACERLIQVLRGLPGPTVLVSNEIGLGVLPLGRETRQFVDALGWLHQGVAAACERVTLVVAGCELRLKGSAT
jgi:adenosylcobinamide kinase/adenosylcobinamide-phosphate guanylyltransferase